MGCDTGLKPIKSSKKNVENNVNQPQTEVKEMNSCLVRREMPEFEMDAYDAATGHYKKIKSEDYKGK